MKIYSIGWTDNVLMKIPDDTINLIFGFKFKNNIPDNYIPLSVTDVAIYGSIELLINNLPFGIKRLTIAENNVIINNLPSSLEILKIVEYDSKKLIKVPFGCKVFVNNNEEIQI